MPRDIPVGNGRLLVCFDGRYRIRDLYFPYVGQENHLSGAPGRFGIWVNGSFAWIDDDGWRRDLGYEDETLVTRVSLYHESLRVLLSCRDGVDFHENLYLREITLNNMAQEPREFRLFFHQNFDISGNSVGDTAAFDPDSGGVIHYKGNRYFLANARGTNGRMHGFATGQKGIGAREGTFRDAEDGVLSGHPIAQGSVDSVIAVSVIVNSLGQGGAEYWIGAGKDWETVRRLDTLTKHKSVRTLLNRTRDYWHLWARKETPALDGLDKKVSELYRRSLLILATQIDENGGILAANDSDVIQYNRDTYSYVWPRDGALVANALDLAGYPVMAANFYGFASRLMNREGYLLHKYNPDGSLASSWHPWTDGSTRQLPIQEDETALVIWALWNHFVAYRDIEFIKPLYRSLIKRAGDFMCTYRDSATGLPDASYDLWEERRGIISFTVGTVFGGLTAASLFCTVFGEEETASRYRDAAAEIRDAASTHLWREDTNRFCRMLTVAPDGTRGVDDALDASLWGLFAFGLYRADDPRIVATMSAMKERLWVNTGVGGLARYEGDPYYRTMDDVPGNPWFICTLWYADYLLARGAEGDLTEALGILSWVADHALPSGVLAEQVDPHTGTPLSVSPLTWSHGTFVATCQRAMRTMQKLDRCPSCGLPTSKRLREEDWLEKLYGRACDTIHGICRVK